MADRRRADALSLPPAVSTTLPPPADTLATLDATLDGRCACGCGRPLDPDGTSAWFAAERCQLLWAARHADTPRTTRASRRDRQVAQTFFREGVALTADPAAVRDALGKAVEAVGRAVTAVCDHLGQCAQAFACLAEQARDASGFAIPVKAGRTYQVHVGQPPADPMARALWLRQHRNTGPQLVQRPPRKIVPRRGGR